MTNFSLMWDMKYDPISWDNMIPFEKQIYIDLILERMKEKQSQIPNHNSIPTEAEYKARS